MSNEAVGSPLPRAGNRYDRMEWAGAFDDLGTLVPFVIVYISLLAFTLRGAR